MDRFSKLPSRGQRPPIISAVLLLLLLLCAGMLLSSLAVLRQTLPSTTANSYLAAQEKRTWVRVTPAEGQVITQGERVRRDGNSYTYERLHDVDRKNYTGRVSWEPPPDSLSEGQQYTLSLKFDYNTKVWLSGQWRPQEVGAVGRRASSYEEGAQDGSVTFTLQYAPDQFSIDLDTGPNYLPQQDDSKGLYLRWTYRREANRETSSAAGLTARISAWSTSGRIPMPLDYPVKVSVRIELLDKNQMPLYGKQDQVAVSLYYDGDKVGSGQTNTDGFIEFDFNFPPETPAGITRHQFKAVASKDSLAAEAVDKVEVERDPEIEIELLPTVNEITIGNTAIIQGRVTEPRRFRKPVKSNINVAVKSFTASGGASAVESFRDVGITATDADGLFTFALEIQSELVPDGSAGEAQVVTLRIKATPADGAHYHEKTAEFRLPLTPKDGLTATFELNREAYSPGEEISLSGQVMAKSGQIVPDDEGVAANVKILCDSQEIATVRTDARGNYSYKFSQASLNSPFVYLTEGAHALVVVPEAPGYASSPGAGEFFIIRDRDSSCRLQEFKVHAVSGEPWLDVNGQPLGLSEGDQRSQGVTLNTGEDDKLALIFPIDASADVKMVLGANTSLEVGKFCRDEAGNVKLILYLNNPGAVFVRRDGTPQKSLDFQIVTPSSTVQSVKTLYYVEVDRAGDSTVAALEGVVRVGDFSGASPVEVVAGRQLSVKLGEKPRASDLSPLTIRIDPELERMFRRTNRLWVILLSVGSGIIVAAFCLFLLRRAKRRGRWAA